MTVMRKLALSILLSVGAPLAHADAANDAAMKKLANDSGCLVCHNIEARPDNFSNAKPIGPPWMDVSVRYRGQQGALDALTETVLKGSSPYKKNWKHKTSGMAMPPNAVAISEPDARRLVGWILTLDH